MHQIKKQIIKSSKSINNASIWSVSAKQSGDGLFFYLNKVKASLINGNLKVTINKLN
jgi:hypothetical protein